MNHASSFVNFADSDDEDYVEMDDEDMSVGLQSVAPIPESAMAAPMIPSVSSSSAAPRARRGSGRRGRGRGRAERRGPPPPGSSGPPPPPAVPQGGGGLFNRMFGGGAGPVPTSSAVSTESVSSMRERVTAKKAARHRSRRSSRPRQRIRKKVNVNVVSVDLGTLGAAAASIATGDAVVCQNPQCGTVMSPMNELMKENTEEHKLDEGEVMWICEFCGQKNLCDLEEEEKPTGESQDYILEGANQADDAKMNENGGDGSIVVFCVDVSGSMCVTQEVTGKVKFRGSRLDTLQSLNDDGSNQYLRGQKRNTTYVSRLQSVQAAIDDQLTHLAKTRPDQKVALVTFSNEVTIIGDGTVGASVVVTGDKLFNLEACKADGSNFVIGESVANAKDQLSNAVWGLEENGQTALGPALVVSTALASQRRGSSVILCTDGLANIGMGSLEVTEEQEEEVAAWYENIGNWALTSGVTVNIVSITDEGCRLENLGKVADVSGGDVERINPLELSKNFQGILEKPVLATLVQATMFLHPGLKFRSDEDERLAENEAVIAEQAEMAPASDVPGAPASEVPSGPVPFEVSRQVQDVGNVFADSEIFFEYAVIKSRLEMFGDLSGLPFQVQIVYTRRDGAKMMRVITQVKPVSRKREEVLQKVNFELLGTHAQRKTARLCEDGDYEAARAVTYSNAAWMASNARSDVHESHASGYMAMNMDLDGMMMAQQQTENASSGFTHLSVRAKKQKRKSARSDHMSSKVYKTKSNRSRG